MQFLFILLMFHITILHGHNFPHHNSYGSMTLAPASRNGNLQINSLSPKSILAFGKSLLFQIATVFGFNVVRHQQKLPKDRDYWRTKDFERFFEKKFQRTKRQFSLDEQFEILRKHDFYFYPEFRNFIRTLPAAQNYIESLYHQYSNPCILLSEEAQAYHNAFFLCLVEYRKETEIIKEQQRIIEQQVYEEAHVELQRQQAIQKEAERKEHVKKQASIKEIIKTEKFSFPQLIEQKKELINYVGDSIKERLENRCKALEHIFNNRETYSKKSYSLSSNASNLLKKHNYTLDDYTTCFGNEFQHVMHAEFVSVVDQLYSHRQSELTSSILSCAHAGIHNNRVGVITVTMDLADLCWSLLDCTKAVGQAVLESAEELADQILHPCETISSLKEVITTAGYYLAKLLESTLHLEVSPADSNTLIIKADLDELMANCKTFACAVGRTLRETPTPELVKQGTKLALQFYAIPKLCSALKPFAAKAVKQVPEYLSRLEHYGKTLAESSLAKEVMPIAALSQETMIPAIADKALEILETAEQIIPTAAETEQALGKVASLETKFAHIAHYIKEVEALLAPLHEELPLLKKKFDLTRKGFFEFENKFIKIAYEHILGPEFIPNKKRFAKLSGFHHDFMGTIEKSGLIKLFDKKIFNEGFYTAKVLFNGIEEVKTFFPADWFPEKIISKIFEAYEKFIANGKKDFVLDSKGNYKILGMISEKIFIEMCITKSGYMTTAYPILKDLQII